MENVESLLPYLEPIRKSVSVPRPPAEAFEIFTARFDSWWPLSTYSIHRADAASCGIEPRVGGEVYEIAKSGARATWGSVLTWDPPRRLVLLWHPGRDPRTAQELELRFVPVAQGTRVELEHRGWAKLGKDAAETRTSYAEGWDAVLEKHFAARCSGVPTRKSE